MGWFIAGLVVGLIIGAGVALAISHMRSEMAARQMREAFSSLAAEALDANSRRLAESASQSLDDKKRLIDQSVQQVKEGIEQVRRVLQAVEADRKQDVGRLGQAVASLSGTAGELHRMLASTQRRGAWGERMAADILRLVGMQEGVNYNRQSSAEAESGRPDFTFFLPNDLKVNMDVKFPLESYKAYTDAVDDAVRAGALRQLVTAVRNHVRAVASRGYVDSKGGTVPYVIVFLASEQIYALVLEAQADLIDESLAQKVVLASPLTLYAMLAVMHQAARSANVMRTAAEVIELLGQFDKQWQNYNIELDKLGERITAAGKQFELVRTTRTNQLQRPLDKIEQLRQSRELPGGGA